MTMRISVSDAVAVVRAHRGDSDVVVTTMSAAREWLQGDQHPLDFVYVPSSMSQATSLALGIALAQPDRRVIVCNGDGSMLMNLGSLATIAATAAANLTILLFDNGVYQVTGSQPVPAAEQREFAVIARGCGLRNVSSIASIEEWRERAGELLASDGPTFIVMATAPSDAPGPRSPGPGAARARAFMQALQTRA